MMRPETIQRFQVREERRLVFAGELTERGPGFVRRHSRLRFTSPRQVALARQADALDDFVLHVGDVHHVGDGMALEFEVTADEIGKDERAPVADMGEVIDRRSAAIHADRLAGCVKRREFLD
jgi:hypothetical protein